MRWASFFEGVVHNSEQLSQVFGFLLCSLTPRKGQLSHILKRKQNFYDEAFLVRAFHHMMSPRSSCGFFTSEQYNGLRLLVVSVVYQHDAIIIPSLHDPNIDLRMIIEHQAALCTVYGYSNVDQVTAMTS